MTDPESPILVVDDDQAILSTVAEILHLEGYPVVTAGNGMEALAAVERERPSLVVLDMRMPVLDGWGFARQLRDRGVDVPILVMTAAQDAGSWADEVGAEGYLAKPFDLLDLLEEVNRLRRRNGTSGVNGVNGTPRSGSATSNGTGRHAERSSASRTPAASTSQRRAS